MDPKGSERTDVASLSPPQLHSPTINIFQTKATETRPPPALASKIEKYGFRLSTSHLSGEETSKERLHSQEDNRGESSTLCAKKHFKSL